MLVRSIYLDEAGISRFSEEPVLSVAGVILHTDTQWRPLHEYFKDLVNHFIPEEFREGHAFHTFQIWHRSGIYDKKRFGIDTTALLHAICDAIPKFQLPVVWGTMRKSYARAALEEDREVVSEKSLLNTAFMCAFSDAVFRADLWMKQYGGEELANLVMENNDQLRKFAKATFKHMKSGFLDELVKATPDFGFPTEHVRLNRIIDAPSFMEKDDAPPLQLADFCAYMVKRYFAEKGDVTEYVAKMMASMMYGFNQEKLAAMLAEIPKGDAST
jgi:hypothetical protein